jgi:UDP-N-acetylmuramoylalanine--D-glutamate ligase
VRVADTRTAPPYLGKMRQDMSDAEFRSGEFDKSLLQGVDVLALSPGLSTGLEIVVDARAQGMRVVGEVELFAQGLRDLGWRGDSRVLAITGTNGKTTTTALTGHLCKAAGFDTAVAGNISPAALDALMACVDAGKAPRIWVLELSSFQLETTETLAADAATVLNISDDHLDRYQGLDDYAAAKQRIFSGDGIQVLNRQDARVKRMAQTGRKSITFGLDAPDGAGDFGLRTHRGEPWIVRGDNHLLPVSGLSMAGLHNATNAMAALALCAAIGSSPADLLPALRVFRGLPHRVEKIASANGVDWYDDSKGTNVGATVAALEGMGRPVVLILGGEGKGQDFSPLREAVARHARSVVLLGRDARIIADAIGGKGNAPPHFAAAMDEAVGIAAREARPGDAVLLSPACASFDMFRNYEHRAQAFVAAVKARIGAVA